MFTDSCKNKVHIIGGGHHWTQHWLATFCGRIFQPLSLMQKRKKQVLLPLECLRLIAEALFAHTSILEIGIKSLSLFPTFLRELEEDTQTAPQLHKTGTLIVGIDRYDAEWIERAYTLYKSHHHKIERLTSSEVRKKEPLLSPRINHALYLPEEAQINPKHLYNQVKQAFFSRGGRIVSTCLTPIPQENIVVVSGGA